MDFQFRTLLKIKLNKPKLPADQDSIISHLMGGLVANSARSVVSLGMDGQQQCCSFSIAVDGAGFHAGRCWGRGDDRLIRRSETLRWLVTTR